MRTTRRKAAAPLCISSNEMERLRSFTRPPPKKEEDLRNEHLKKLSEDRVKNWPNTLAAQRKKKEQWKEIEPRKEAYQRQSRQRGARTEGGRRRESLCQSRHPARTRTKYLTRVVQHEPAPRASGESFCGPDAMPRRRATCHVSRRCPSARNK